jgi:hypothetical protein
MLDVRVGQVATGKSHREGLDAARADIDAEKPTVAA